MAVHRRNLVRGVAALGGAGLLALALAACDPATSSLDRPSDPVVLKGAKATRLIGVPPGDIVAFRSTTGGWQQIPVQVDERKTIDLGLVYHSTAKNVPVEVYTDANTFTGADTDTTLDANDEIVFMASDAGGLAPSGTAAPNGVITTSGVDIRVTDPLASGKVGHVYLFRRSGTTLKPGANKSYVSYAFSLTSGPYKTTYKLTDGPNPENSTVTTANYRRHFSDRWLGDELTVLAGSSTKVDILERNKSQFSPGYCGRTEDTFDDAEGAFIANKNGPVRAIRSYIGANSGPYTERTHLFYAGREDVITDLRVHAIPSVIDYLDLTSAASSMTYRNNLNTGGVTVDGNPDSPTAGAVTWESLTGAQGSVVQSHGVTTNLTLTQSSWYEDDTTPATNQCSGDGQAWGQAGPSITSGLDCTDPATNCTGYLTSRRSIVYRAPGVTATQAAGIAAQSGAPLATSGSNWNPPSG